MTRYIGHLLVAKASMLVMLLLLIQIGFIGSGCGNRTPPNPVLQDDSIQASTQVKNKALYDDIFWDKNDNYCSCSSTEGVDYYLANPEEFVKCTRLSIFNEQVDCDLFKRLLKMKHLTWLDLDYSCDEIPVEVLEADHLTSLAIDLPPSWKCVPSILFRIPNLTGLGVRGDNLSAFEDSIPTHPLLEDIDFYYSPMEKVPLEFARYPKLMRLNIGTPEHVIKNEQAFRDLRPDISFSSNQKD